MEGSSWFSTRVSLFLTVALQTSTQGKFQHVGLKPTCSSKHWGLYIWLYKYISPKVPTPPRVYISPCNPAPLQDHLSFSHSHWADVWNHGLLFHSWCIYCQDFSLQVTRSKLWQMHPARRRVTVVQKRLLGIECLNALVRIQAGSKPDGAWIS